MMYGNNGRQSNTESGLEDTDESEKQYKTSQRTVNATSFFTMI